MEDERTFAKDFAAYLLMPDKELKRLIMQGDPLPIIAFHFGVTDDAIRYRMNIFKQDHKILYSVYRIKCRW